jgi:diguanylate cyclase (GGDEF)-like protein/PAS domain S-box-containing protein
MNLSTDGLLRKWLSMLAKISDILAPYLTQPFYRWTALALATAVFIGTAAYNYQRIDNQLTDVAISRQQVAAQLLAATLSEKFGRSIDLAVSFATRVQFQKLVAAGQWDKAIAILHSVPTDFPFIERVTLVSTSGTLMADSPILPGVRGMNFAYRDWYQGVSSNWQPYISEVFQRKASPQLNVFSVTVPIKSQSAQVMGILSLQIKIESLLKWLEGVQLEKRSSVYLVDPKGKMLFHAIHENHKEVISMPATPRILQLQQEGEGVAIDINQVNQLQTIIAYATTPDFQWGVAILQPVQFSVILAARNRQLVELLSGYGIILLLVTLTIILTMRSASARQRAKGDALIKESEERYRSLITGMTEGVVLQDAHGIILTCNPSAERILGLNYHDMVGRSANDQRWGEIHEDGTTYSKQDNPAMLALQTGLPQSNKIMGLRRPNDELIWISINAQPLCKQTEPSPYAVAVTFTDISERKQTEENLRIAATAFEAQESLMITDANGVILRVNRAFSITTGYSTEEVVGKTPSLLKSGLHEANFYREMWETINLNGSWQGEIWDKRKNGEIYPKWLNISAVKSANGVVTHYVGSHQDITKRKAAEEQIQLLAFYDPLTLLPNRRLLMDRLQHALATSTRSGKEGALLFLDMDHFKDLNDTLGHEIGDMLLQQVAQRLTSCVRAEDTVARLGGDEFVVLLEALGSDPLENAAKAEAIGEHILVVLNKLYQLAKHEYRSSASIGITLFNNQNVTIDDLMKQADIAMYQAKKEGRNMLRFFDPEMQAAVDAHAALESEMRKALVKQQFHLYYQIQVDNSKRPLGAEVLIRWIHPERGFVPPAEFIPLAEESELILTIGAWVLDTACAQLKIWQQNALTRELVLSVNVSAKQFQQLDFVEQVQADVLLHGINPNLLKMELTEGMLVNDIDDIIVKMNALKKIGIQISLDDFGTGFSSLQYLKLLPLDQLKIDQSFVRDMVSNTNDYAIVKTIIDMAKNLKLAVIAEGVETAHQRELLFSNGCEHFQGYLFSKPLPLAEFEALLQRG